ncbi:MAG: DEAD/DEAH box helicase [Clostridiales bacterium]|nr:DEAD/DEAH box helicase [Clostridiales bacterium]
MENSFNNLGLSDNILKSLNEMGFTEPTEVQKRAIPRVMNGEDLIVMSKTGSGKTGAFGIPMLEIIQKSSDGPQGLVLTPTRELAVQVDTDIKKMAKFTEMRTTVVYGQHSMVKEVEQLNKGVEIVTGTPGRVFDHIRQGNLNMKNIKFLVLDEADRMLDMGFIDQVVKIIKTVPKERVTLLFSATMPQEIQKLSKQYMKEPFVVEIESDTLTVDSITQIYYKVEANEKRKQLNRLLTVMQPESCIVFCNTRYAVDNVNEFLTRKGYSSKALHGANTQSNRMRSIQQFKKDAFQILCATDVAARGLHIDDLSLVINYDVPLEKDSYVHRIGRTGRAGHGGKAITLVTKDDLFTLYEIEEHVGVLIEEGTLPTDEEVAKAPRQKIKVQPEKVATKKPKPAHGKPAQGRPTHSKTEQAKPVQAKPAQGKPSQSRPEQSKPVYPKTHDKQVYERPAVQSRPNTSVDVKKTQPVKKVDPVKVEPVQKKISLFDKIKKAFGK